MVEPRNKQEAIVLDFFAALSEGDLEKVKEYFDPDVAWETMFAGTLGTGRHEGRDTVLYEFLAPVRGTFKPGDPKTEVDSIVSSGDHLMVESHAFGERLDGKRYENRYAWAIDLKGDRIVEIREYMDSLYAARFHEEN